jgi:quinol monooxygenase YgiN
VIVLARFRVPPDDPGFAAEAAAAADLLGTKDGLLSADLARSLDDPELWTLTTRWRDVGSYRRALQGYEAKTVLVPLLSRAIDEPTAYEDPALH